MNTPAMLMPHPSRHKDARALLGRKPLEAALASGVLCQPWRGVVMRSDQALDTRTRAVAALLSLGEHAVISGPTAVALHGYPAADSSTIHVTVPRRASPRPRSGMTIHRDDLAPDDIVRIGELPVLAQDLALAECLCTGDKYQAFASLDQALRGLDRTARAGIKSAVNARLSRRHDQRGVTQAKLLADLATGMADSPPESIFRLIVVEDGLPVPTPQVEILTVNGRLLYVLDMAWEEVRIALEYDGYAAHEERAEYDAERDRRLAARGWIVIRAGAADLRDPTRVLGALHAAFAARR